MEIHATDLRDLLRKTMEELLDRLRQPDLTGDAARYNRGAVVETILPGGRIRDRSWNDILQLVQARLAQTSSYDEVRRFLAEREPYATYWQKKQWLLWGGPESPDYMVAPLVAHVIVSSELTGSGEIDWALLEEALADWHAAFTAPRWRMRVVAPLEGFYLDGSDDSVELSRDVRIEHVSVEERQSLSHVEESAWEEGFPDYAIKVDFELPKERESGERYYPAADALWKAAYEQVDAVVACLRVLHGGDCAAHQGFSLRLGPFPPRVVRSTWNPYRHFTIDPYDLTEGDREPLIRLFQCLRKLENRGTATLRLAIERYRLAQDRARPEDRLIDLCIVAEALLARGSGEKWCAPLVDWTR